jgi:lipopolysaccharide transport system permease protein
MNDPLAADSMIRRGPAPREQGVGMLRLAGSLFRNRSLVREMARRELVDTHAGQAAGFVWLVVHPILLFMIYAFLFTVVFKVRIANRGPEDYLVYLFAGLGPWLFTQDVIARVSNTMVANQNIVKKVMFPPEVLVAKTLASSLAVQSILMTLVVGYIIVARGGPSPMMLMLPVLIGLHLVLVWGLALLLAALTPYFRDIPELMRIFLTLNIYLVPIMYLPDMVPGVLRFVLHINPFSYLIWCYQDVLYHGAFTHPWAWLVLAVFAGTAAAAGSYVFVRLRHYFGSIL